MGSSSCQGVPGTAARRCFPWSELRVGTGRHPTDRVRPPPARADPRTARRRPVGRPDGGGRSARRVTVAAKPGHGQEPCAIGHRDLDPRPGRPPRSGETALPRPSGRGRGDRRSQGRSAPRLRPDIGICRSGGDAGRPSVRSGGRSTEVPGGAEEAGAVRRFRPRLHLGGRRQVPGVPLPGLRPPDPEARPAPDPPARPTPPRRDAEPGGRCPYEGRSGPAPTLLLQAHRRHLHQLLPAARTGSRGRARGDRPARGGAAGRAGRRRSRAGPSACTGRRARGLPGSCRARHRRCGGSGGPALPPSVVAVPAICPIPAGSWSNRS